MDTIRFPANGFEEFMIDSIRGYDNKTLVYVDGEDIRTAIAAAEFVKYNSSRLVFLGNEKTIAGNLKDVGLSSDNIKIIEPSKSGRFSDYKEILLKRFMDRGKDVTEEQAAEMVSKPNYFASLMLKTGEAHGGVSGSLSSTESMMRGLIQVIGTGNPKRHLSGAAIEIFPGSPYGLNGQFLFADTAVIPDPDEAQMIDIVLFSYHTAKALFSGEPKVAMLSYSTKGSAKGEKIDQINRVIEKVRKLEPDMKIDGELQFDAAVVPEVAKAKGGESEVAGQANVLIFPNLDATNICIKAVHRLGNSFYYGSVIQGSPVPFNDLSRGCAPVEVLTMSAITLMQVKEMEKGRA